MTARQSLILPAVLVLLAGVGVGVALGYATSVLGLALLAGLSYVGSRIASRRFPLLHRRVFRRAWWIATIYWFIPVVALHASLGVLSTLSWIFDSFVIHGVGWTSFAIPLAEPLVLALSVPLWYAGWKRVSRLAGTPIDRRGWSSFLPGAMYPLVPVALLSGLILLGAVLSAVGRI
jgi:hypothetical protein